MVITAVAGVITFIFTTLLTIAGVGAAFILIPVFIGLGIDIYMAMATALLLNSVAKTIKEEGEALPIEIKAFALDEKERIVVMRKTVFFFPKKADYR